MKAFLPVLSLVCVALPLLVRASAAPTPPPPPPAPPSNGGGGGGGGGGGADPWPTFEPATTCDPTEKTGPQRVRAYVLTTFGGSDAGIVRACSDAPLSEHNEGRAWDWVPPDAQARERGIAWVTANAHALGVPYLISDAAIWRAYAHDGMPAATWGAYTGPDAHTSHVHISFTRAGAQAETSAYAARGVLGNA